MRAKIFFDFNLRLGVCSFMLLRPERAGWFAEGIQLEETAGWFCAILVRDGVKRESWPPIPAFDAPS